MALAILTSNPVDYVCLLGGWLLFSFGVMFVRPTHAVACGCGSFILLAVWDALLCIDHRLHSHSIINVHLDCFQVLAGISSVSVKALIRVFG